MADWRCPCHGQSSSDRSQIATIGDVDSTAVTIRPRKGRLAQINTSRRAAYGYDQRCLGQANRGRAGLAGLEWPAHLPMTGCGRCSRNELSVAQFGHEVVLSRDQLGVADGT